jgi:serine/threonine protein kinase
MPVVVGSSSSISLERYGLYITLEKGVPLTEQLYNTSYIKKGSFSHSQARFDLPSGSYSMVGELGQGTYGKIYQAISSIDNTAYAIKVMTPRRIADTIKEAVIHILLERESETQAGGPFVPRFFEIAYDPERNLLLLRIERMHGNLSQLYQRATAEQNDSVVPETVADLAHILQFFYTRLQFNHRDLKSDNIAFVRTAGGKNHIKLIDFGFGCLKWKGIQISGAQYFSVDMKCYIPSRDLSQFLYELLLGFRRNFSARLVHSIEELLRFPLSKKLCDKLKRCKNGQIAIHELWKNESDPWTPIYDFLNHSSIRNPKTTPAHVHSQMLQYMGYKPSRTTSIVKPSIDTRTILEKQCMPEQIYNPKTRRCVRRDGLTGRKITNRTLRRFRSPTASRSMPQKTRSRRTRSKGAV